MRGDLWTNLLDPKRRLTFIQIAGVAAVFLLMAATVAAVVVFELRRVPSDVGLGQTLLARFGGWLLA
jgi:hypothetical protein